MPHKHATTQTHIHTHTYTHAQKLFIIKKWTTTTRACGKKSKKKKNNNGASAIIDANKCIASIEKSIVRLINSMHEMQLKAYTHSTHTYTNKQLLVNVCMGRCVCVCSLIKQITYKNKLKMLAKIDKNLKTHPSSAPKHSTIIGHRQTQPQPHPQTDLPTRKITGKHFKL